MSKAQMLRESVKQRLTAAAEEIFGLFERTIAEYEEERCRSKEENERQRKLLDSVFTPQLRLQRTDVHQLSASEEIKEKQGTRGLQGLEEADITKFPLHLQQDTEEQAGDSSEPEMDHSGECKETGEAQSGLNSLKKDDVPVSDSRCSTGEKQFSCSKCRKRFGFKSNLKRHMRTHRVRKPLKDCKGQEPARKLDPDRHPEPHTDQAGDSSEPETDDSEDQEETREAQSALKSLKKDDVPVSDTRCSTGEEQFSCSKCTKRYGSKRSLKRHMRTHTGERPFSCSVSDQRSTRLQQLRNHQLVGCQPSQLHQRPTEQMETEADGEDCGGPEPARKSDPDRHPEPETDDKTGDSSEPETDDSEDQEETREAHSALKSLENDDVPVSDTRCSTGDEQFSCSKCAKRYGSKSSLKRHMRTHSGLKYVRCSVCKKGFLRESHLQRHMITHTGEKAFSCSVCKKAFGYKATLQKHMTTHTGEKRFSCSVCKKCFAWSCSLKRHLRTHKGKKRLG
ncbi:zinc finger protein 84-like [Perca flavescens]|uniref:zinc finger protein 84-like n=1 Tax=Perca flavescens TaxID=8167 RepID=UPI00106DDE8D|nr:zinc finger protein 84-like [Perca flavescens]